MSRVLHKNQSRAMRFKIALQNCFKKAGILSIILAAFVSSESAIARIGENFSECENRYGKHIEENDEGSFYARVYSKQGYLVVVLFYGSPSREYITQAMIYSKQGSLMNQSLSADEVGNFLQSNSGSQAWDRVDSMRAAFGEKGLRQREIIQDAVKYERWVRSDDACFAFFDKFDDTLVISNMAFGEYFSKLFEDDMSEF